MEESPPGEPPPLGKAAHPKHGTYPKENPVLLGREYLNLMLARFLNNHCSAYVSDG
ncbi:hypothetical protein CCACVL1_07271, partial [Corchorus capsularis]